MLDKSKLWRLGTIWAAALLAKSGVLIVMVTMVSDTNIGTMRDGWIRVVAVRAI